MQLDKIQKIADKYKKLFSPFCERAEIAGSVRRKKPEPKDIEIVAIAKNTLDDFLKTQDFKYIKNGPKYKQIVLPEGVNLDLFIVNKDNWGLQFAIRTGSAEFSHKVLALGWVRKGYHSKKGILYKEGKSIYIKEERDLFKFLNLPYIKPEKREI